MDQGDSEVKFFSEYTKMSVQLDVVKVFALLMIIVNVTFGVLFFIQASNVRTIIIPPSFTSKFEVVGNRLDNKYFEEVGNYDKSFQFLERAVELSDNLGEPGIHILVLNELGKINASTNRTEEAFQNFEFRNAAHHFALRMKFVHVFHHHIYLNSVTNPVIVSLI